MVGSDPGVPYGSWKSVTRRGLATALVITPAISACALTAPKPTVAPVPRQVRVAMPPLLDRLARVDRARDLQVSRGEALREGVEVKVVPTSPGNLAHEVPDVDRLAAARRTLAAGERIDVLWTPFIDLGDLEEGGHLAPIRALAARDRVDLKEFMPQALQPAFSPIRGLMALPDEIAPRQVYFRADHLEEAGIDVRRAGLDFERPTMTWEALRRVAIDAACAPAGRGRAAFDAGHAALPMAAWAWQAGVPTRVPTGEDLDRIGEALAWLGALSRELNLGPSRPVPTWPAPVRSGVGGLVPDGAGISPDDVRRHPIIAGTATIAIDSTRLISALAGHDDGLPIRVVELPRRSEVSRAAGWADVSGYALVTGASDDAWDLLRYLSGEDAAYASARAVAMRLPPIDRPAPGARAPEDLPGGPRRWFPPLSGRVSLDRFLARQYRTGIKSLDEAHDHGIEQVRHVGTIPFGPGTRGWLVALEDARHAVIRDGRDPWEVAKEVVAGSITRK